MERIAVITGGISTERDVSLRSAENVRKLLAEFYDVDVFDFPGDREKFLAGYKKYCAAIPLIHGKGGEDGALSEFLERLGVPYLFSGVSAHAVALDKDKAKIIVAAHSVAVPRSITIQKDAYCAYQRPSVIKPLDGGSSVATAIVRSQEELDAALRNAFDVAHDVLVEDYVRGDEFTVAVIDDGAGPRALPVIMIRAKDGFFDYKSKYTADALAEEICPAPIDASLAKQLQQLAVAAHTALGCAQVSRTDIIVDENGTPWFLETNTIPGMTETSLLPKACAADGVAFVDVLRKWIDQTRTPAG